MKPARTASAPAKYASNGDADTSRSEEAAGRRFHRSASIKSEEVTLDFGKPVRFQKKFAASDAERPEAPLPPPSPRPTTPQSYAPPSGEGSQYLPPCLPDPLDAVRGPDSKKAWYVVTRSLNPGIYKSWCAFPQDGLLLPCC